MWELPLPDMYKKQIKSRIADMKNIGNAGQAGTITAALFLKEFVDVKNWVHCDIAGTAFLDSEEGIHPAGGTGTPIRSICALPAESVIHQNLPVFNRSL